jgi:transposase
VFLRQHTRKKGNRVYRYWTLCETRRTDRGPRQRTVAYLGDLDEAARLGVAAAAGGSLSSQLSLFESPPPRPEWVEVDLKRLRVERPRDFGGAWLGLEVAERLGLPAFLREHLAAGREDVPWPLMALVLVLGRLCDPSSELALAERVYSRTALPELLGIPPEKVNDDRLYRTLDRLLPCKKALEKHLKSRLGELFGLEYDLLLYDVTSTYFEGQAARNPQAQRGYSRDQRPDCKQVCIALVVSREGMPLGYEVFDGNRADVTTVEEIVEMIEEQYGEADRIWVMDRGMVSEENIEFLQRKQRRYIVGTPKGQLRRFEAELVGQGWSEVHPGLEVKLCPAPGGAETFIHCRSTDRREKEKAMRERAVERLTAKLEALAESCAKRTPGARTVAQVERRVGRILGQASRGTRLLRVEVAEGQLPEGASGPAPVTLTWKYEAGWAEWAQMSEGCYLLRTNVTEWSGEELWRAYIQLTEAEAAFRIQKSDLSLRPIWRRTKERVQAHILVCFLAYVLWTTLEVICREKGLGDCPRRVFDEIAQLRMVEVVLPTRDGIEIRKRCISRPEQLQRTLLQLLEMNPPESLPISDVQM